MNAGGNSRADAMAEVFAALGEPHRAALLERLVLEGRGTATSLALTTDVSRQAVDRHLRVLAGAGLVGSRREGREVVYSLRPQALQSSAEWLTRLGHAWEERLLRLKGLAEREPGA